MADIDTDALRQEVDSVLGAAKRKAHKANVFPQNERSNIRHVVGVVSGKGGVGKSLVTGIIATELARRGNKVGILDADVTGPSIPKMMGLSGVRACGMDNMIVPVETKGGIKVMSANLVLESEDQPVIWRGPVVANAIEQFYSDTLWGDIDFLLVDMPPGTSDVALTVFNSLPIEGVVIVSSPQDLVQMVVGKAVNMAAMMEVPVFGLVENMAYIECPHCGEKIMPYGPSRLAETAEHFGIDALGQLPIDPKIAASCDNGNFEQVLPEGLLPDAVKAVIDTATVMDAMGQEA